MKKLRLTESDLRKLIASTVNKIIKEDVDTGLLSKIVQGLQEISPIDAEDGENEIDVTLDEANDVVAFINFDVDDKRYYIPGEKSNDYDVPDSPGEVTGDFDVYINRITIYEDGGEVGAIEDNGMVRNALKDLIEISEEGLGELHYSDLWEI